MLKRKETKLILAFIACLFISFLFAFAYRYDNQRMTISGNGKDYSAAKNYSWYIDSITKNTKQAVIEGWAAKLGSDITYANRNVVLIDSQGQLYHLNTVMVKRTSVTDYFKDGHNYDDAGVSAACLLKDLKSGQTYKVGIIVKEEDGSQCLIKTDKTVIG